MLISVALLMGATAVFLLARWVGVGGPAPLGPPVLVAAGGIEAGVPLTLKQVQVLQWPSPAAPAGAFNKKEQVVGRVLRQALVTGEPILESRLAPIDGKAGLSATLAEGQRAITVRVNDVIGVAGFALPGTYVDVLVSARDAHNEAFSRIVLERVKILAVAQETASDPTTPKVVNAVTLALSPAESERLDLARSVGSLSLALRNELDRAVSPSPGTRLNDLIARGLVAPSPAVRPTPTPRRRTPDQPHPPERVEEIRGTHSNAVQSPESSHPVRAAEVAVPANPPSGGADRALGTPDKAGAL